MLDQKLSLRDSLISLAETQLPNYDRSVIFHSG
jgi:hypothetical protein